jgi:hypothetical protein
MKREIALRKVIDALYFRKDAEISHEVATAASQGAARPVMSLSDDAAPGTGAPKLRADRRSAPSSQEAITSHATSFFANAVHQPWSICYNRISFTRWKYAW